MDAEILWRAVLPLALAYAAVLVVLAFGSRRVPRGTGGPSPRWGTVGRALGTALGGLALFLGANAAYCAGATETPGACIASAAAEAGFLTAVVVLPGFVALSVVARAVGRIRGLNRRG